METDDFLNVLERFINRRGCPGIIRSNCGTNFKGADRVLKEESMNLNNEKIKDHERLRNIKFNPLEAPHMGGVWERLAEALKPQ